MKTRIKTFSLLFILIFICPSVYLTDLQSLNKIDLTYLLFLQKLIQNLTKSNTPPSGRTLILIHGYGDSSSEFISTGWTVPERYQKAGSNYYNRIIAINYYWDGTPSSKPEYYIGGDDAITKDTDIYTIAEKLYQYIIDPANGITDKIDILGHSMGGLVARALVVSRYADLVRAGYIIDDTVMLGTPNKGSHVTAYLCGTHPFQLLISLYFFQLTEIELEQYFGTSLVEFFVKPESNQHYQFSFQSPFINSLKLQDALGNWDETPYGENDNLMAWPIQMDGSISHNDICWTSIAGDIPWAIICWATANYQLALFTLLLWQCGWIDSVVSTDEAYLSGADNQYWWFVTHTGLVNPSPSQVQSVVNILTEGVGEACIIEEPTFEFKEDALKNSKIRVKISPSPQGSELTSVTAYIHKLEANSPLNIGENYEYEIPMSYDSVNKEYYLEDYFSDGVYETKIVAIDDVGHIGEKIYAFWILDDDSSSPEITLLPGNQTVTDSISHLLEWEVTDTSGLSSVEVKLNNELVSNLEHGSFNIGNQLETYKLEVIATDNDNDLPNDQLSSYAFEEVTVIDDDTTSPNINIAYSGANTDGNPGYWTVTATDEESGIDKILAQIDSGDPFEITSGTNIAVPNSLGYHSISITASNADLDRGIIDQESTTISDTSSIVDDDVLPPEVTDLDITDQILNVGISFNAIDQSGIGSVEFLVDGKSVSPIEQSQVGDFYSYKIKNEWILEFGIHNVEVRITDADNDRVGDSLITTVTGTFETSVEDMTNYILNEISVLRTEVDQRVSFLFDWMIIGQLNVAECLVQEALSLYSQGSSVKSIILDKLAKASVELSGVITIILDWLSLISEEDGDYILESLHAIRDYITLIMGAIVGTDGAVKISKIETKIEQLADTIFENHWLSISLPIDTHLWCASENLDYALIGLAADCTSSAEGHIITAECELQHAITETIKLRDQGKLSGEEAEQIINQINILIQELIDLHTHTIHEGDCPDPDTQTNPHTDTTTNDGSDTTDTTDGSNNTDDPNTDVPTH